MTRKVVISSVLNQVLVGILENGKLAEFFIETDEQSKTVGNIYQGKIENVLPGMSAAFVDIGLERNGFLFVDDLRNRNSEIPINKLVKKGQSILVQVTKEPEGTKGARVISHISIPGRYLVLMPHEPNLGVSRQVSDEKERERLREIAGKIQPKGMGLIVRTVAEHQSYEDLERDCQELLELWEQIEAKGKRTTAPALIYQDHDLIYRILRDLVNDDVEVIIADQPAIYKKIRQIAPELSLPKRTKVELYQGKVPVFDHYGIRDDLERATRKQVWLNSGGYLIIDQTEALVSIDVNTGKYVGSKDLAATVLQTNVEAAGEIAKQLRLRNIGGIIIIDFIDMDNMQDKNTVLSTLEAALAKDKTKSHVLGFTGLGLVEMTRKKAKQRLTNLLEISCPHCEGSGRITAPETVAISVWQRIYSLAEESDVNKIIVECHPVQIHSIAGRNNEQLKQLQQELQKEIVIKENSNLAWDQTNITGED